MNFNEKKRCNSEGVRRSYVLWTIKCISRRFMDKRRHYLPTATGLVCLADVAVKQFDQHECFSAWQRICNAIISMLTLLFNESRCVWATSTYLSITLSSQHTMYLLGLNSIFNWKLIIGIDVKKIHIICHSWKFDALKASIWSCSLNSEYIGYHQHN